MTKDGASFQDLGDYPNPEVDLWESGCLVVVDDRNIFLAGGYPGSNKAYMYNLDSNSWRELANMRLKRLYHSCGLIDRYNNGTGKEIIVAGGSWRAHTSSVEIFSMDTEEWREGNLH